jgi:hypothetical protein
LASTDSFHRYVRKHIAGFPSIRVDESAIGMQLIDGEWPEEYVRRRRLEGSSESPIELDSPLTSKGSVSFVSIANLTEAVESDLIDNATASYIEAELLGYVQSLPIEFDDEDKSIIPLESEATFTNLVVTTSHDLIQWPKVTDSVVIPEFNNVEILQRAELKSYKTTHISKNTTGLNVPPTRHLESSTLESLFEAHMEEFRNAIQDFLHHRADVLSSRGVSDVEEYLNPEQTSRRLAPISKTKTWQEKMKAYNLELVEDEKEELRNYRISPNVAALIGVTSAAAGVVSVQVFGVRYLSYSSIFDQASPQCSNFRNQILDFYDHIDFFVMDNLERLNNVAEKILKLVDTLKDLEKDLTNTKQVDTSMERIMPLIARIPYAGPLAKIFYEGFHQSVSASEPASKALKRLNKRIEDYNIKKRVTSIINVTTAIGEKINEARTVLSRSGHALILADAVCPSTTSRDLCGDAAGYIQPVNQELNNLREDLATFVADLKGGLHDIGDAADAVIGSSTYKGMMSVMSSASVMFDILEQVLNERIGGCATMPICGFRQERKCTSITFTYYTVKTCKKWRVRYPCGTRKHTEQRTVCVTLSVPYSCPLCAYFTLGQIVNGVVSVVSLLTSVIDKAVASLIQSLGIKFDVFQLPGLPSANDIGAVADSLVEMFDAFFFTLDMPAMTALKDLVNQLEMKLDISQPSFPKCDL